MLVEERNYTLTPGGVAEYLRQYEMLGRAPQERLLGRMIGCFQIEVGELNQIVFWWGYENEADRAQRRAQLLADPDFAEFRGKVRHLLVKQQNRILRSAPCSPL